VNSPPYRAIRLQRTLAAVYRFHDAFFQPFDDRTPSIDTPLEVAIPSLNWTALRVASDLTYRFSWPTLTGSVPSNSPSPPEPPNFGLRVVAPGGEYVSHEPAAAMTLSLPRPVSTPPKPSDFLILKPLWPTVAFRPPRGETAVRGSLRSSAAQPVLNLKVEIWLGAALTPPAGTPFTFSDAGGDFLFRLPLLKGAPGKTVTARIRLNGGAITVVPSALPIVIGHTQAISFQRT
jgi:hypothetical protein